MTQHITLSSHDCQVTADSADQMRAFGARLARIVRAGDLIVLTGPLGAGKTTLTQGLGQGLGVRGQIVSPTFTIAREYPNLTGGPDLVHVDAYRLGSFDELDALDLDTSLDESVTVVEWGEAVAHVLNDARLEITLARPVGELVGDDADLDGDAPRTISLHAVGPRWDGVQLTVSD